MIWSTFAIGHRRCSSPWETNETQQMFEYFAGYGNEWTISGVSKNFIEDINTTFDRIWAREERLARFGLKPEDVCIVLSVGKGYLKFDPNYDKLKNQDDWRYISSTSPEDLEAIAKIKGFK